MLSNETQILYPFLRKFSNAEFIRITTHALKENAKAGSFGRNLKLTNKCLVFDRKGHLCMCVYTDLPQSSFKPIHCLIPHATAKSKMN